VERARAGEKPRLRLIRPRTIIYTGLIVLVSVIMLFTLITRSDLDVSILRDRNPLFVALSDGSIRNGYTVKIINKQHAFRHFTLQLEGLPDAGIDIVGTDATAADLQVGPDSLESFRVFVTAPRGALAGSSNDLRFLVIDHSDGKQVTYDTVFRGPQ
jgi:polyferredoxin